MKFLRLLAIFTVATVMTSALHAQALYGNIYGRVTDDSGAVLPGVGVTLTGGGAPQSATSGSQGEFRFINLSPGTYTLKADLSGFATIERTNVQVGVGTNTEVTVQMKVASVATTITVTGEPAQIDARKQATGTNFTQAELKSIPTGRDPWVILQQTPGVLVDRVNVGGSQGGQQDNYVGKGTDPTQNAWNVDGVTITDMAATGSSPTYYDFDAFQEMQATTGGSDPSIAVPGVTLNMVTKRGTNEVHGSARVFDTPHQLESNNTNTDFKNQQRLLGGNTKQNRIYNIQDYGVEAGGPLWTDKAWLWGSYGRNQIDLLQAAGTTDKTTLENFSGKLNIQPVESNAFTGFYFRGDKTKFGRNAGVTRPQPSSWDQSGPTTVWKGEDSQVFGPNFVADVSWNYVGGGFGLSPEGGNVDVYRNPQGIWQNSYAFYSTYRPQHQLNANLSSFFNTGSIGNELKFGFGYRKADLKSNTTWPGNGAIPLEDVGLAKLTRPKNISVISKYYDGFLSDTLTASNLTVNVGVRYDNQYGNNAASVGPGLSWNNDVCDPNVAPGPTNPCLGTLSYGGGSTEFKWKNWEPRIGVTYALGSQKTTLLRASYARFADQLGQGNIAFDNPINYSYLYYYLSPTYNADGSHKIQSPSDLAGFAYSYGVDVNCPTCLASPNQIDRNLKAPKTDEFTIGVDQQLLPELVAGVTYTYRKRTDIIWTPYIGITGADFSLVNSGVPAYDWRGNFLGNSGPLYGLTNGLPADFTGGRLLTNRPGYNVRYDGLEFQATKRLSNRWMAHAGFTWTNWKQHGTGGGACQDPTNSVAAAGQTCADGITWYGGAANSGAFSNVFINSKWNFNVNGMYQLPLNFNVSANIYGRQGYPIPYYVRESSGDGLPARLVIVGDPNTHRNKNVFETDLRLEKVIPLFQKADLTLSFDAFNMFNSNTPLQMRNRACNGAAGPCDYTTTASAQANQITETQAPRVFRFGARLSF
jgi:hypothetical protein